MTESAVTTVETDSTTPTISFPRKDIMNIFQFGSQDENNEYYSIFGMRDVDVGTLDLIHSILRDIGSPEERFFRKKSTLKGMTIYFAAEQGGSLFMWIDYNPKNETEPNLICRSVLIIADIPTGADENAKTDAAIIHQVITGVNVTEDKVLKFKPNEVLSLCLPDDSEEEVLAQAYKDKTVIASFCYAESALRSILSGLPLDMDWNQEWLFDANPQVTFDQFQYLVHRTPEEFAMDIDTLQQEALDAEEEENTKPMIVVSEIPLGYKLQ